MIAHPMFDHVTLRVADLDAAARFYTTVLDTLGVARLDNDMGPEWDNDLSLAPRTRSIRSRATSTSASSPPRTTRCARFWRAGVEAGYAGRR